MKSNDIFARRVLQWKTRVDDPNDEGLLDPREIKPGDRILAFNSKPNTADSKDWKLSVYQVDSVCTEDKYFQPGPWPREVVGIESQEAVWVYKSPDETLERLRGPVGDHFGRHKNGQDWTVQALRISPEEFDEFMSHVGEETLKSDIPITTEVKEAVAKASASSTETGLLHSAKDWLLSWKD